MKTKMDRGTKVRVLLNASADIYAQSVAILFNLVMIPLFLTFWQKDLYGEWLVLAALPSYIALSNLGLRHVAGNKMTMLFGAGEIQKARETLHTVWVAQLGLNALVTIVLVIFLSVVNVASILRLSIISSRSAELALLLMSIYAMLNLQAGIFVAIYRVVGENARGIFVYNTIRLLSVLVNAGALLCGVDNPAVLAGCIAVTYLCGTLILFWDTRRIAPGLRPGLKFFDRKALIGDVRHGLGFMAYPLGRAITNQGMLLFVNAFMSSSAVVTISTLRTVVNTSFQCSNLISRSTWPEFSRMYGQKGHAAMKRLFCYATALGCWAGLIGVFLLVIAGPYLLFLWTRGEVDVDRSLMAVFIVPILLNSAWFTSSVVFNATNRHMRVALCFLLASVMVPLIAWFAHTGLNMELSSVGLGFICMDAIMLIYVVPRAFSFIGAKYSEWIPVFLSLPFTMIKRMFRIVTAKLNR